ncbi:hypothetical protein Sta7437_3334 [Stanieria cyanosphaera PCC 7437]|uniref:Uncharacterized protein n=1 Tax=Stanieria cyanosphaera (strain ATCC 29371 / PCC 7437) TaxID=111780 RepID=K9XW74_STAC7|nr:hypothetical protein [Stanieria cyanosphaera]AFZ36840.1 hypothetical protein Sta7437_3334 [Stanieria cyanosphaera PCC 7437]
MRVTLQDDILFINHEDLPPYKKGGSIVRNSYFWALKAIACYTSRDKDWEFDRDVWVALSRMLMSFSESGYLGDRETMLEFPPDTPIPPVLRSVSTWL